MREKGSFRELSDFFRGFRSPYLRLHGHREISHFQENQLI